MSFDKTTAAKLLATPKQVALFMHLKFGWPSVWEIGDGNEAPESYVQISEPLDVTFQGLESDEVIQKAVEALNAEERRARNELNAKLIELNERRAQLLSLTHEPAPVTEDEELSL